MADKTTTKEAKTPQGQGGKSHDLGQRALGALRHQAHLAEQLQKVDTASAQVEARRAELKKAREALLSEVLYSIAAGNPMAKFKLTS